jgi:hypothetical protein
MLRPISAGRTTEDQRGSIAAVCPSDSHKATKAQSDCALFFSLRVFVRTQPFPRHAENLTAKPAFIFRDLYPQTAEFQHLQGASRRSSVTFQLASRTDPEETCAKPPALRSYPIWQRACPAHGAEPVR